MVTTLRLALHGQTIFSALYLLCGGFPPLQRKMEKSNLATQGYFEVTLVAVTGKLSSLLIHMYLPLNATYQ